MITKILFSTFTTCRLEFNKWESLLVTIQSNDSFGDRADEAMLDRFKKGVRHWATETDEGKEFMKTHDDIDADDLYQIEQNKSFQQSLKLFGIDYMEIEPIGPLLKFDRYEDVRNLEFA